LIIPSFLKRKHHINIKECVVGSCVLVARRVERGKIERENSWNRRDLGIQRKEDQDGV